MGAELVYLSIGSNVGARDQNLTAALAALPSAGIEVRRVSAVYETEPVDYLDQEWFLNCVVEGKTEPNAIIPGDCDAASFTP